MDGSDEHYVDGGGESAPYTPAGAVRRPRASGRPTIELALVGNRPTRRPPPPEPATVSAAESPAPHRRHPRLMTAAAVCVIVAPLAVVGAINWRVGDLSPPPRRYSVVDTPPVAIAPLPAPVVRASPQPLVPLLPPDRARGDSRTNAPLHKLPTAPSARAAAPQPTRAVTGPAGVISGPAGKCLHAPGDKPADGTPVLMTACKGSLGDRWIMASDGTVRASGKCLDVAGDQVADGATVQLSTCDGAPGQQWRFTDGGDLMNPNADKCLNVRDSNPTEGAVPRLWKCTGGPNQKWSIPA